MPCSYQTRVGRPCLTDTGLLLAPELEALVGMLSCKGLQLRAQLLCRTLPARPHRPSGGTDGCSGVRGRDGPAGRTDPTPLERNAVAALDGLTQVNQRPSAALVPLRPGPAQG